MDEGDESSEKQREGSLNDSSLSNKTEVFPEGLKCPVFVSILLNCLHNLKKEIKLPTDIAQASRKTRLKTLTQLTDLQVSVNFINEKSQEHEQGR